MALHLCTTCISTNSNSWRFIIVFIAEESALAPSFPILFTLTLQVAIYHNNNNIEVMLAYYNTCSLVIDFKAEDRAIAPSLPILFLLRLFFFYFKSFIECRPIKTYLNVWRLDSVLKEEEIAMIPSSPISLTLRLHVGRYMTLYIVVMYSKQAIDQINK